jgi:hypothetical protein
MFLKRPPTEGRSERNEEEGKEVWFSLEESRGEGAREGNKADP